MMKVISRVLEDDSGRWADRLMDFLVTLHATTSNHYSQHENIT